MAEFPTDSQHDEATWRQLKQDAALLLSEDPHDGTGTRDAAVQCVRPVVSAAASVSVDPIEALRPPPSAALVTRRSHSRQPKILQDASINCQGPWLMHACSATRPTSETNAATVLQAAHRGRAARRQSTRRVPNEPVLLEEPAALVASGDGGGTLFNAFVCLRCGAPRVQPDAAFCHRCGRPLSAKQAAEPKVAQAAAAEAEPPAGATTTEKKKRAHRPPPGLPAPAMPLEPTQWPSGAAHQHLRSATADGTRSTASLHLGRSGSSGYLEKFQQAKLRDGAIAAADPTPPAGGRGGGGQRRPPHRPPPPPVTAGAPEGRQPLGFGSTAPQRQHGFVTETPYTQIKRHPMAQPHVPWARSKASRFGDDPPQQQPAHRIAPELPDAARGGGAERPTAASTLARSRDLPPTLIPQRPPPPPPLLQPRMTFTHKRRNFDEIPLLKGGKRRPKQGYSESLLEGNAVSRDLAVPGSTAMLAAPGWREPPTRTDPDVVTNRAHTPSAAALKPRQTHAVADRLQQNAAAAAASSSKPPPQDWRRRMLDSPAVRSMLWTARAALTQQRHDYPEHSPSVLILVEICTRTEGAVKHCSIDHQMYEEYFARLALAIGDVLHSPEEGSLASVKCMVSIAPPPDRYAQQRGLKVEGLKVDESANFAVNQSWQGAQESRLGAFEVYAVTDFAADGAVMVPRVAGIHSKLATRKFPSSSKVVRLLQELILPIFRRIDGDRLIRRRLQETPLDIAAIKSTMRAYGAYCSGEVVEEMNARLDVCDAADRELKAAVAGSNAAAIEEAIERTRQTASAAALAAATTRLMDIDQGGAAAIPPPINVGLANAS